MTRPTRAAAEVLRAVQDLRIYFEIATERIAKVARLNPRDLGVLDVLHAEGPSTPKGIANRTGIQPTTLTAILTRLERDGRIRRQRNPDDGRSSTMAITQETAQELTRLFADTNDELTRVVAAMSAADRIVVVDFLRNVMAIIGAAPNRLPRT